MREVLEREGLRPNRRRGQCFLVDANLLRAVVQAFDPRPDEAVLEIGTGAGNLTVLLLAAGARVLSVERDQGLAGIARRLLPPSPRLVLLHRDVLQGGHLAADILDAWTGLARREGCRSFAVCSNFPYAVASRVILEVLARGPRPLRVVVGTVQWEVARRFTASPGSRDFGALTVAASLRAETRILRRVPPGVFWPPPRVASAVLRVVPREDPGLFEGNTARREVRASGRGGARLSDPDAVLKALLPLRRRQLLGAMRTVLPADAAALERAVRRAGLDPARRVGTIEVAAWRRLLEELGNEERGAREEGGGLGTGGPGGSGPGRSRAAP